MGFFPVEFSPHLHSDVIKVYIIHVILYDQLPLFKVIIFSVRLFGLGVYTWI